MPLSVPAVRENERENFEIFFSSTILRSVTANAAPSPNAETTDAAAVLSVCPDRPKASSSSVVPQQLISDSFLS